MTAKKKSKSRFAISGSMVVNSRSEELERVRDKIAALGITERDIDEVVRNARSRRR